MSQNSTTILLSKAEPSPDDMRQAAERMVNDLLWLVNQAEGSVTWCSTRADLIDMVHTVWLQGVIRGDDGRPISQNALARKAFAAVGMELPRSMSSVVCRLNDRSRPFFSLLYRYAQRRNGGGLTIHRLALLNTVN